MEEAKFTCTYRLDIEGFRKLNEVIEKKVLGPSKKKTARLGYAQMLISAMYLFAIIATKQSTNTFLIMLAVVIMFLGIYCVMYYPYFFKKKLNTVIEKTFAESEYLNNDITLRFFDEFCEETNYSDTREMKYGQMDEVKTTDKYIMILVGKSGICIPKDSLGGQEKELVTFLLQRVGMN